MVFDFDRKKMFDEGKSALAEAMHSPASIVVAKAPSGRYYVEAEAVERYMLCNGIDDGKDALVDIADANKIDFSDISLVGTTDLIDDKDLRDDISE